MKTNKNATAFKSVSRPMNAYEKEVMQQNIEEIYEGFVSKVAAGRGMTWAQVDSIGQGRVWSGTNALQIGLVDSLGGLEDALAYAASLAGLENYTTVEYPKEKDFMTQLMEMFSAKAAAKMKMRMAEEMGTEWNEAYKLLMQVRDAKEPQVWARMEDVVVFE
ncbi:MAG: S49 family peptidase [Bacteroidales bacterium]|nr:S49 family peptidase [Bacteroidales bacterium]